jgi:hypothetical protein
MSTGRGEAAMRAFLTKARLERAERAARVQLRYYPQNVDPLNKCPDFIVHCEIDIPLFPDNRIRIRVPILIEVEAGAGFQAGFTDLEKFVQRTVAGVQPATIEIPFLIATENDQGGQREQEKEIPVRFISREIAIPTVVAPDSA